MHKTIYLDTNILLHYQPFNQINWLEVVKAESVTIVFPPVILRELNKHKDSHPRPQIKKRAGETIKRLSNLLDSSPNIKLNEKILVFFEDRDPDIDFPTYHLNSNVQDDHLIASIIVNRQEAPNEQIVLVTSDLGLTFSVKAKKQGIDTLKMPENFKIADEPDPNEIKVKQLEQQIRDLNSRSPNLSLVYQNSENHFDVELPKPVTLTQADIDRKMEEVRKEFPIKKKVDLENETRSSHTQLESISTEVLQSLLSLVPQEEIERYNTEVKNYILLCEDFIVKSFKYGNLKRRSVQLNIDLVNDGTMPAEDVDVYLHFPDGFLLTDEENFPAPPTPPKHPVEPMTEMQRLSRNINFNQLISSSVLHSASMSIPEIRNVSAPSIKRSNSYDVHVYVEKVKHNFQEPFDPLFVVFQEFAIANSFKIEYRILAANIPHEITGELHVIVKKEQP